MRKIRTAAGKLFRDEGPSWESAETKTIEKTVYPAYPVTLQYHNIIKRGFLTMKTILALLALSASTAASAACYLIYSPTNELVWRGGVPPVKMDAVSLSDEVRKIVPIGHLVFSSEPFASCSALDATAPRTAMRQGSEELKRVKSAPSAAR